MNWALKAQTFDFFMTWFLKEKDSFLGFTAWEMSCRNNRRGENNQMFERRAQGGLGWWCVI